MQMEGVFLNLQSYICACNFLVFFLQKIFILRRFKETISKKLMKLFLGKVNIRYHFIFIPTNLVINVRKWTWLICESTHFHQLKYLKIIDAYSSTKNNYVYEQNNMNPYPPMIYIAKIYLWFQKPKLKEVILWNVR
jgi:hypothetical protein